MPADPKYRCSQVLGSSSGSGPCSLARRTSARQDHANTICRHHGFRTTVATICLHTPNPHPKQLHVRWNCCWLSSGTCRVRLASSGPFPFSLLPVAVLLVRSPMCAFVFFFSLGESVLPAHFLSWKPTSSSTQMSIYRCRIAKQMAKQGRPPDLSGTDPGVPGLGN